MVKKQGLGKAITAVAVVSGVVLGGVAGALIGATTVEPKIVTETVTVTVPGEVVTETIEVEVPVNVTVEKIVEVEDVDFKATACDMLGYDVLSECVEEVEQEDIALNSVIAFLEEDFDEVADKLEDMELVNDEDDLELVKIYSDYQDVEELGIESDFDDNEYEFTVKIKVDDDEEDSKRYFYVTVSSNDGELEIENITE